MDVFNYWDGRLRKYKTPIIGRTITITHAITIIAIKYAFNINKNVFEKKIQLIKLEIIMLSKF